MPEQFAPGALEQIVRKHLPDLADRPRFEPIRTGKFNTSFYVDAGGKSYVLRIAPPADSVFLFYERDMMRQEPEIHALLLAKTAVPVARILAFDVSHTIIDRDYILMERLPGRPLTEMTSFDYASVLREVGRYLAETHALTADRYGYLGPHRPMEPQKDWPSAFRVMWNKLLDDIIAIGFYDDRESVFLRELLERNISAFDRPVSASLLHMDIWHQNILVDATGRVTGIVDWDRALWGDPEIEFAVLDYCGISEPPFWEGYGQPRDTSPAAQTRHLFYYLYELQKYIVIRAGRNRDPDGAARYKDETFRILKKVL